ncbi:hypothetical protein LEMLEM_LOCUS21678 [Lemmus lemmus]
MHGWWCGSDRARVTSRLLSGPCKQSRPMTCSLMPFEEEASSVMMKKNRGVPRFDNREQLEPAKRYPLRKDNSQITHSSIGVIVPLSSINYGEILENPLGQITDEFINLFFSVSSSRLTT